MSEQATPGPWYCFKFPTKRQADNFVKEVTQGYSQHGTLYVQSWQRPKRTKGGYLAAVMCANIGPIESLAGYWAGVLIAKAEPAK